MESNFKKYLNGENGLATFTNDEVKTEFIRRELITARFPLEVFNSELKPFLAALNKNYDIPSSFIGLTLLSASSTAIGTSYAVTSGNKELMYLPIWGALTGISSSGKSMVMKRLYGPHNEIQNKFDEAWRQKTEGLSSEKINFQKLDTILFRDSHVPTLIRSVLPDNPKGLAKYSDELLEWINGMNQLTRKEGTDEQFWVSSWNCTTYNAIRSGKQKVVIPRPFVNIIGGAPYRILHKFFANDRDTNGFTFRILFALPEVDKIADLDIAFDMPEEFYKPYENCINRFYYDLPVNDPFQEPRHCVLQRDAIKLYNEWSKQRIAKINRIEDSDEQHIQAGILGKIKEYALRFAAVLRLLDCAMAPDYYGSDFSQGFRPKEPINGDIMLRALALADYFYDSAAKVCEKVQTNLTAPPEVLMAATMLKLGRSQTQIAEHLYGNGDKFKMKVSRNLKKWIRDYPKVFNALSR
jgi:hypothetical protein